MTKDGGLKHLGVKLSVKKVINHKGWGAPPGKKSYGGALFSKPGVGRSGVAAAFTALRPRAPAIPQSLARASVFAMWPGRDGSGSPEP